MKDFEKFDSAADAEYMRHFPEKGDSWKTCNVEYLWRVLDRATKYQDYRTNSIDHLLDIANMCRMIWTRHHSSEQMPSSDETGDKN